MTSCMTAKENICAYLDNELSAEEKRLFEEHIESCRACKQELDEMSGIISLCTSLPQQELPQGFKAELHEKLLAVAESQKSNVTGIEKFKRIRYIKMISSVAAGLLLIFLTGSLIRYGFLRPDMMAKTGQSTALSAMDAPAQPSADAGVSAAADNGAPVGAAYGAAAAAGSAEANMNDAQAADNALGIMGFAESGTAPDGTESDRSVSKDRSSASAYAASQAIVENVSNKVSAITITAEDPETITGKIKALALENNGAAKEPVLMKFARSLTGEQPADQGTGSAEAADTAAAAAGTASDTVAQPLSFIIPSSDYDRFLSSVNEAFGAANVQSGALVTEDLTQTLNEKIKQSGDIEAQIQELQQDSTKNVDKINDLKTEKEILDDQIETMRLDSDFVNVTIYINRK
ncbi:MAG TPA: anti-sigma factor [Clostridia bacterium]|nr:anti-sigma factor [Clostridia bacterium]